MLVISFSAFSQEEEITLTTYYPSPYGSYRILDTLNLNLIPQSSEPAGGKVGSVYYDSGDGGKIRYYDSSGWRDLGSCNQWAYFLGSTGTNPTYLPVGLCKFKLTGPGMYSGWHYGNIFKNYHEVWGCSVQVGMNSLPASPENIWFASNATYFCPACPGLTDPWVGGPQATGFYYLHCGTRFSE
jgi:hypothetical protein